MGLAVLLGGMIVGCDETEGPRLNYPVPDDPFPLTADPALPYVLLVGDSIAAGYAPRVANALRGEANVVRMPGYAINSRVALGKLRTWESSRRWDVIVVNFGLHDLARDDGPVAVPCDEYATNIDEVLTIMQANGTHVLWAATTPVSMNPSRGRHWQDVPTYNSVASHAVEARGMPSIDLYNRARPWREEIQMRDGVHFSGSGCAYLGDYVAEAVRGSLGRRH
jgi:lysophospholipase L1-like esterase